MPSKKRSSKRGRPRKNKRRSSKCRTKTRYVCKSPTEKFQNPLRDLVLTDCHNTGSKQMCQDKGWCTWRKRSAKGSLRRSKSKLTPSTALM